MAGAELKEELALADWGGVCWVPTVPRRGIPSRGLSTPLEVSMRGSAPCEDEMSRAAAGRALACPFFDLPNKKAMMVACTSAAGCKGLLRKRATHPAGVKTEGKKGGCVATDRRRNVRPGCYEAVLG